MQEQQYVVNTFPSRAHTPYPIMASANTLDSASEDKIGEGTVQHTNPWTFFGIKPPVPWHREKDVSFGYRQRLFRVGTAQILVHTIMKIVRETAMVNWTLYSSNQDYFAHIIFVSLGIVCFMGRGGKSHTVIPFLVFFAVIAVWLFLMSLALMAAIFAETAQCNDIPADSFDQIRNCFKMAPQLLANAGQTCALGIDMQTRATGTCPMLLFDTKLAGGFWMFVQWAYTIFNIITLAIDIMDLYTVTIFIELLNQEPAKEEQKRVQSVFQGWVDDPSSIPLAMPRAAESTLRKRPNRPRK
jgi:hypothetical protein